MTVKREDVVNLASLFLSCPYEKDSDGHDTNQLLDSEEWKAYQAARDEVVAKVANTLVSSKECEHFTLYQLRTVASIVVNNMIAMVDAYSADNNARAVHAATLQSQAESETTAEVV